MKHIGMRSSFELNNKNLFVCVFSESLDRGWRIVSSSEIPCAQRLDSLSALR